MTKEQREVAVKKQELEFAKLINPKAWKDSNKTEFKKQYKGKLPYDLETVWKWIDKNRKG
jgi:hypothetical protein